MSTPAAPELPGGFEWITTVTDAADTLKNGLVPLLRPGSHDRAQRWAGVLRSYGDIPALTPMQVDQRRVVVSVGDAADVGRAAAVTLGRTHHRVPDLLSASAVDVPANSSVLLVASAPHCTFATLHSLLQSWERDGVHVGVLTGRDQAGMFFSLAKILADQHSTSLNTDIHLDGTTGTVRTTKGDHHSLTLAMNGSWRSIAVDAHGTGSHTTIGPFILCGLSGDRERLFDGAPVMGGCAIGHCRAGRKILRPVLVRDLQCRTLVLFVCNGITLSPGEQFPSDVTLTLAALEGYPATTIGLLRQDADTTATESTIAARLLSYGVTNGTVTSWLSQDATGRGCPSAYLLLGDPDHAQPAITPGCSPVPWPDNRQPALPAILDRAGKPVHALLARDGAVAPLDIDRPLRIGDAAADLAETVDTLVLWITDTDEAAHIEDTLRALMSTTSKRRTVLSACLNRMQEYRLEARRLALQGIRHAQEYRRTRRGLPIDVPLAALHEQADGWANALNETVTARAGAFRLWEALEANHLVCNIGSDTACWRCGAPRVRTELVSPVSGPRVSITCPRCGPHAHYPASQPLQVNGPAAFDPGGTAEITVTIPPAPHTVTGRGLLATQIQDRAGLTALTSRACITRSGENHTIKLPVPTDLAPDLHRLWALWVHRFRVSLLQLRIPATPAIDSQPLPASGSRNTP